MFNLTKLNKALAKYKSYCHNCGKHDAKGQLHTYDVLAEDWYCGACGKRIDDRLKKYALFCASLCWDKLTWTQRKALCVANRYRKGKSSLEEFDAWINEVATQNTNMIDYKRVAVLMACFYQLGKSSEMAAEQQVLYEYQGSQKIKEKMRKYREENNILIY